MAELALLQSIADRLAAIESHLGIPAGSSSAGLVYPAAHTLDSMTHLHSSLFFLIQAHLVAQSCRAAFVRLMHTRRPTLTLS